MELVVENIESISVIQIIGRLEAANRDELTQTVKGQLSDRIAYFLLDLSRLEFIDSSGLGCLVSCLRSADKTGGALKIVAPQAYVAKLFETTRLDRVFEIFPDRAEALKSF